MTAEVSPAAGVPGLRPEWDPWLAVVNQALGEAASPDWDGIEVDTVARRPPAAPILAGASVTLDAARVLRLARGLRAALRPSASAALTAASALLVDRDDVLPLFRAAIADERPAVVEMAERRAVDAQALQALASLLPMPLFHACRRRLAGQPDPHWPRGHCPLCGSWPAFAENLGIDNCRRYRCSRCGTAWPAPVLGCAFCGAGDHGHLVNLVVQESQPEDVRRAPELVDVTIAACSRCGSYLKQLTRLEPCPPLAVALHDLATVHLDLAALERDYVRPATVGHPVELRVAFN